MADTRYSVAVLGAGAWGTALALEACHAGHAVTLWCRDPKDAAAICRGEGPKRLPGISLPEGLRATVDKTEALAGADAVLVAVPAQAVRETITGLDLAMPVALCAKGIERATLALMTDVMRQEAPKAPVCVLSGPTFALEVARGLPTAIALAGEQTSVTALFRKIVGAGVVRAYLSDDPIGAEIGGAIKNVIAVASGIAMGRGLGENARAALVSRGLAEIVRLAEAMGGRAETVMGLAGAGDLVLTAMSETSRNTAFGLALGKGARTPGAYRSSGIVTEGAWTAQAAQDLAKNHGVDLPICGAVAAILKGQIGIDQAIDGLMERPHNTEFRA